MLRYVRAEALQAHPVLRDGMFRDRAAQFSRRLGWEVTVDASGCERDAYDALSPVYMIAQTPSGHHAGSMRMLPTTGRTMLAEHFAELWGDKPIASPHIWESTRFCAAPGAPPQIAALLMLGALEFGVALGLSHLVGVFDARMIGVYRRLGWSPAVTGRSHEGRDAICAGLWAIEPELRPELRRRAGVSAQVTAHWTRRAFGTPGKLVAA
ncbi:acyl-homoserine-lactone synthase [Profundibacterium mesophilum]|uniref:Acyl-homoserine-lactone synthase n=1 Tax=Profundibacterium mesophilum KAUST100406-0324 TaxID=1037889 RepID=A0A921NTM4_9RHOB|nr:acyl-homoserine-lactone synthase [Profundibacterium mesophilum]KAF0675318.1 Acyl-homoserine-lactone synthase [Profundibacterium mesophilum KAUST100406-0324]